MDSILHNNLNLARKLRPQTFDTIIGQEIPVRMLKNSLYLHKLFPVYLFAGQRGCGKTSTARVFAAALNCHNLELFQQNPAKQPLPCLTCASCRAMLQSQHPDFIEIDAASNTGVDNVRQIIETANYIPLTGRKKIYLIDEAHMLSKAAFNAFLKILEEPPVTVHFILATTELQKIPETVLSRCFQLTFNAINHTSLKAYLEKICQTEQVDIESAALDVLIDETDGSARDALNLLEQVRFSTDRITIDSILGILGKVSTNAIITLFENIINQKPQQVLEHMHAIDFKTLAPLSIWNMIIEFCRALLWVKFGVKELPNAYKNVLERLELLAGQCSLQHLHEIMQFLWSQEQIFSQTDKKHAFLELIFLQLSSQFSNQGTPPNHTINKPAASPNSKTPSQLQQQMTAPKNAPQQPIIPQQKAPQPAVVQPQAAPVVASVTTETAEKSELWQAFVQKFGQSTDDFMLHSILVQAHFLGINHSGIIALQLKNHSKFLLEKVTDSSSQYVPLLKQYFENFSKFEFIQRPPHIHSESQVKPELNKPEPSVHHEQLKTMSQSQPQAPKQPIKPSPTSFYQKKPSSEFSQNQRIRAQEQTIDVRDQKQWPLAHLIMSHFPGKIVKKLKVLT